jgi:rubrerythrin
VKFPHAPESGGACDQSSASEVASPTLADVVRRYWDAYLSSHSVPKQHRKVVDAIRHCRTFERGYHVDMCTHCGHTEIRPNSCRNRYCPICQAQDRIE